MKHSRIEKEKANRRTDDSPLLPEERGERNTVPAMQGIVGVCADTAFTLSVRRREINLPDLYRALL